MKKHDIVAVMRGQFRVWHGTENSQEILEDTVRAIGYQIFNLKGDELNKFTAKCRKAE